MNTSNVPSSVIELNQQKVEWLASQIAVDYPTRESVLGKASYLDLVESSPIDLFSIENKAASVDTVNWIEVDFHKMTVMFAKFMAQHASIPDSQREFLQEFLAQIILTSSDKHRLYLAFSDDDIIGSALASTDKSVLLLTDCLILNKVNDTQTAMAALILQLLAKEAPSTSSKSVYVQCLNCK